MGVALRFPELKPNYYWMLLHSQLDERIKLLCAGDEAAYYTVKNLLGLETGQIREEILRLAAEVMIDLSTAQALDEEEVSHRLRDAYLRRVSVGGPS